LSAGAGRHREARSDDVGSGLSALRTTRLSLGTVFLVVFVLVSSGPFGVEEMVSASGPGMALLLILLIPLVWGAPLGLVCAELGSALPQEGGYYVWIERGLGRFWAFQAGWWLTLSGTLDTALYVVLAVTYANSWLGLAPIGQWLLSALVIATFAALNVRSLATMALSSVGFSLVILLPSAALAVLGLAQWRANPFVPLTIPGASTIGSLGLGLAVAIWFYSGYESISTMAGELDQPQRVIPRALLLSLPAVTAVYFLPTLAGLASVGRWEEWGAEGPVTLVDVGRALGGSVLAVGVMAGALVSNLALYNAYLASGARTTLVMAEKRMLPRVFARVHPRFGTPVGSILIAAGLHALLATRSFEALLAIDVLLFVLSYLLIFAAFAALRVREPTLARPFRIPVRAAGTVVVVGLPTLVAIALLAVTERSYLAWGALAAASGPVAYAVARGASRSAG
jgi:amino acid transporter